MLEELNIQMAMFVGASLLQEFLHFTYSPRIYYFPKDKYDDQDDERVA